MENEIWRPIAGFSLYEISSLGRIRRKAHSYVRPHPYSAGAPQTIHTKARIIPGWMQTVTANYRRRRVSLCENGRPRQFFVHRLVLEAFHGPKPYPGAVGRHLNGKTMDCAAANLAWGTVAENVADAKRHGTHRDPPVHKGEKNPRAVLTDAEVKAIRAVPYYRGVCTALGRQYATSYRTISRIRLNQTRVSA